MVLTRFFHHFSNWTNFFSIWPNFFTGLAGKLGQDLATLIAVAFKCLCWKQWLLTEQYGTASYSLHPACTVSCLHIFCQYSTASYSMVSGLYSFLSPYILSEQYNFLFPTYGFYSLCHNTHILLVPVHASYPPKSGLYSFLSPYILSEEYSFLVPTSNLYSFLSHISCQNSTAS